MPERPWDGKASLNPSIEFSVQEMRGAFEKWYRVCFRNSDSEPWTRVLGTAPKYDTREEAEQVKRFCEEGK